MTGYRWLWLLAVMIWIAGCAPVPSAPTDDPYVGLALAEAEAARYQAQLTGTAQAFDMQVIGWTATAQSWTPTASLTPAPTSTPTISPTPTVNVTGTLAVEKMQAEITDLRLEQDRKARTNSMLAAAPYIVGFLALTLAVFFGVIGAKRLSMMPTPVHDVTGKPLPMLDVVNGVVVDVDRMPNGMGQMTPRYMKSLPMITAERQDRVTNTAQLVDMKSRTRVTSAAVAKLLESQGVDGGQLTVGGNQLPASVEAGGLFPLPAWEIINGWQGEKSRLPYGITAQGLGLVDVDQFPHLATIGKTGEGKSRRFFRPLITCALAAGHRVVVIGKAVDFFAFEGHPNMTLVKISQMTEPRHAERYVNILRALVEEMNRRDETLTSARKSTWTQAGRERTFIILDELGNAMRLMPSGMAEQARIWVEGLVSEGRKAGFNMAVANQRATGMAGILSQTGKAIFRVERDEERAHKSLAGASGLRDGYFYARFGDVRLAGGFEPTDDEIARFLQSRPVPELERDWVDGRVVEAFALPLEQGYLPSAGDGVKPAVSDIEKLAETIRAEWHEGMSGRGVGRLLGKPYSGYWKDKIDQIVEVLRKSNMEGATA